MTYLMAIGHTIKFVDNEPEKKIILSKSPTKGPEGKNKYFSTIS